jgi:putative spermidine/putrescine transport system substrate-binding protein
VHRTLRLAPNPNTPFLRRNMSVRHRSLIAPAATVAAAAVVAIGATAGPSVAGVSWSTATSATAGGGLSALVKAAKAEGSLNVIALPSDWANYGKEISTFEKTYGIKVNSEAPDDSSAQEIQAIEDGRGRSSRPDVVDVGESFAVQDAKLFAPYKVQTWSAIPTGYKATNGDWYNDYGGYISFGCDMNVVKTCPTSWSQLESSAYKGDVSLNGIPGQASAATSAVWAAALNSGGSLKNASPGLSFFNTLKSDGNLNSTDCDSSTIVAAGSCPILINWDYLNSAKSYDLPSTLKWKVVDPTGTPFAAYYVQAIAADAPHPAAARLWEEFLYSTKGQNIWLEGGARPVELPALVKAGTENKAAYKQLPVVKKIATLPTYAETATAGETIAAGWTA